MVDFDSLTDEDYFAHLKEMFRTPGWEIFKQELSDMAYQLNNIQDVSDEKDLWIRRGRLDQIGLALNFEDTIERAEKEADESSE